MATAFPGAKELRNGRSTARLNGAAGRYERKLARPEAYSRTNVLERSTVGLREPETPKSQDHQPQSEAAEGTGASTRLRMVDPAQ